MKSNILSEDKTPGASIVRLNKGNQGGCEANNKRFVCILAYRHCLTKRGKEENFRKLGHF